MHGPAKPVEGRRVVVVHAPAGGVGGGVARPGDLVGLGEGDGVVESGHGLFG